MLFVAAKIDASGAGRNRLLPTGRLFLPTGTGLKKYFDTYYLQSADIDWLREKWDFPSGISIFKTDILVVRAAHQHSSKKNDFAQSKAGFLFRFPN